MEISMIYTVVAVFLAVLVSSVVANILYKKYFTKNVDDSDLEQKMAKIASDALNQNSEHILNRTKDTLTEKEDKIKILVDEIRKQIDYSNKKLEESESKRIKNYSELKESLTKHEEVTKELRASTQDLKKILSNNQMRGAFGEQVAEDLLKLAGFVVGQHYEVNKSQSTTSTRPDFTIFLPDKTKINIDVKFPYSSLAKSVETDDKEEKKRHLRSFKQDVKQKIKQVSTREYINPEEKTVDFVILFVPNEMIFSYIYDKMTEVWEEAMQKKVVLAGPFSFTAILRMVNQAYSNFRYQENLHQIIGLIHKFDEEYTKYSESIDTLGTRIKSLNRQYKQVADTRDRQLTKVVDKIKESKVDELEDDSKTLKKIPK